MCLWLISFSNFDAAVTSLAIFTIAIVIVLMADAVWANIEQEYLKNLEEAFWRNEPILLSDKDKEYLRKKGYKRERGF